MSPCYRHAKLPLHLRAGGSRARSAIATQAIEE